MNRKKRPHVGALVIGVSCAVCADGPARAAMDLDIAMVSAPKALTEAASRIGVPIDTSGFTYTCASSNCHWDAGSAVTVMVGRGEGPTANMLEVGWNNGRQASNSSSQALFRAMCATVVAAVEPAWSRQQVEAVLSKIALIKPTKGDQETEKAVPNFVFYGTRSVPDQRDFPAEAFVQCGVRADLRK